MSDPRFLEVAPEGFDATMELKWIETEHNKASDYVRLFCNCEPVIHTQAVLCQKWQGAFRGVWVRIPVG